MGHLAPWPGESDEIWRVGAGGGHQPGMGHRGGRKGWSHRSVAVPDRPTVRAVMGSARAALCDLRGMRRVALCNRRRLGRDSHASRY
jgi:hypothetical protein